MLRSVPRRSAGRPKGREDNVRAAVLDAARKLCFARGAEGVSARKIAAEVGCSPTAIYLYYESIDHVLHHLRLEGHALLAKYLRRAPAKLGPVERIVRMQREYLRFGREHPNYFSLMFLGRLQEVPLTEILEQETYTLGIVRDEVARGIEVGEIRRDVDPLVLTNAAWMQIHGLTSLVVSGHAAFTAPGLEDKVLAGIQEATASWLRAKRPR